MKKLFAFVILILLASCMSPDVEKYAEIDKNQKTITVPPGSSVLKGPLKKILKENGWKMYVYSGPSVTEGTIGQRTRLSNYKTFKSRYYLYVAYRYYDICVMPYSRYGDYEIVMVDNKNGAEIFTIAGKGCFKDAVESFEKQIKG